MERSKYLSGTVAIYSMQSQFNNSIIVCLVSNSTSSGMLCQPLTTHLLMFVITVFCVYRHGYLRLTRIVRACCYAKNFKTSILQHIHSKDWFSSKMSPFLLTKILVLRPFGSSTNQQTASSFFPL